MINIFRIHSQFILCVLLSVCKIILQNTNKVLLLSLSIVTIFLFSCNSCCYAQTGAKISKPRLALDNNKVNIFYDILNSNKNDKYNVWVEITDSKGNKINAKAFNGDIGGNVKGGNNKKIIWDLTADNIYLDDVVNFQINAEVLKIAQPVKRPDKPIKTTKIDKPVSDITRGGAILRSAVFPGWGLSKIKNGKPHWIKGVLGYGCITFAYIYNKKATSSYDDYLNTINVIEAESFFNNAVKADDMSETFAYAAVGVWVVDIIWTFVGSSKKRNNSAYRELKNISIQTAYEPNVNASLISLSYNF